MWVRGSEADLAGRRANAAATLLAALLLYGLVLGVQLGAPPGSRFPSVLVALPAVVALAFEPPMIAAAAALAVGTRWVFLAQEPYRIGAAVGTTAAVCVVAALACFVVRRRERMAARMGQIMSVAETVQRAVLRPPPDRVGGLRVAAGYRAAAEFARIGGDLYAVVDSRFGARCLIGDVRGKGLDAVGTAALVLGCFGEAAHDQCDLGRLAGRLDASVRRQIADDDETFVTAFLVEVDACGAARVLACGHPAPFLLRRGTVREMAVPAGLPLGLGGPPPAPAEIHMQAGDLLVMYTDGLAEARDREGNFYPLVGRLADFLRTHRDVQDPTLVVDWLQHDVDEFAERAAHDDAAILALAWDPVGVPSPGPGSPTR